MSRIDELTEQYFSNLQQRAENLVARYEAGLVPDYDFALQKERRLETERFDASMKAERVKGIWRAVLMFVVFAVVAVVLGLATQQFWITLIVFGIGCFATSKALGSNPDLDAIRVQGTQRYIEQLQAAIAEWQGRLDRERQAEEAAAERAIREAAAELEALIAPARASLESWQLHHRPPAPQPYGVSPAGAEIWVRDWMIHMGAEGALVTQYVGDGGVDVESPYFIAQVKHYTGSVGVGEVREHIGVAAVDEAGRRPLFFTSGTYSGGGVEAADRAKMPLFTYSVERAEVLPVNTHAEVLLTLGLNPVWSTVEP